MDWDILGLGYLPAPFYLMKLACINFRRIKQYH